MKKKILVSTDEFGQWSTKTKKHMHGLIVVFSLVLSRRVKVANELYRKDDAHLLEAANFYISRITANVYFTTPAPTILVVGGCAGEFSNLITAAKSGDHTQVELKNAKREELINFLTEWANYVEDIANQPAHADVGPTAVIESAGMRAKPFTPRGKQIWDVDRGKLNGTLNLTAEAVRRGAHEWQYTIHPTDEESWVSAPSTLKAKTTLTGLTRGSFVSCRHRVLTKDGYSDWEGHDPVVVG